MKTDNVFRKIWNAITTENDSNVFRKIPTTTGPIESPRQMRLLAIPLAYPCFSLSVDIEIKANTWLLYKD